MAFTRDREQQLELDNCNVFISISDLDASKVRLCDAIVFYKDKRAQGQQREWRCIWNERTGESLKDCS
jgi:hypothetical protein